MIHLTPISDRPLCTRFASLTLAAAVFGVASPAAHGQFTTVLNVPGDDISGLGGIGSDTQLNLSAGGTIPSSFTDPFDAGLFQGDDPGAPSSTNVEVNVSGGTVETFFFANRDSTINISGGTVEEFFSAADGSEVNISGGAIGSSFLANEGSVVNVSGGTFADGFLALFGSEVNLSGSQFVLDGTDITNTLTPGSPTTIATRGGVALTGLLGDGSAFSFDLNEESEFGDLFSADALLTVALSSLGLEGDYNSDGFVSQGDLDLVLLNWGDLVAPAGFNEGNIPGGGPFDGLVSQNELDGVLLNWGDGTPPSFQAVPEPASAVLVVGGGLALVRRRRVA